MEELKPCPFCGSKNIEVFGKDEYWTRCTECGASGPEDYNATPEDAIRAWNQRFTSEDTV